MPEYVRSDFEIALRIQTPDGETVDAGSYTSESSLHLWGEGKPLTHLHRVSPDGNWLATYDVDRKRIGVRSLAAGGAMSDARVTGVRGTIKQVRWLAGSDAVLIATSKNLYLGALEPGVTSRVRATPVFQRKRDGKIKDVLDARVLPDGVLVRVLQPNSDDDWNDATAVFFVPVGRDTDGAPQRIEVEGLEIQTASVLADGQFVVQTWAPQASDDQVDQALFTFATRAGGEALSRPSLVSQRPCADAWCSIVNWSPGSERMVYALEPDKVVIEVPHVRGDLGTARIVSLLGEDDYGESIHALWANQAEDRVVAANEFRVRMWDGTGRKLWSWDATDRDIHSVHFDTDDRSVLVASGKRILRVDDGEETVVLQATSPRVPRRRNVEQDDDWVIEWEHEVFVDGVTPLPNGGLAYMVVRTSNRPATWEESEPLMDAWEQPDANLDLPLVDVFSRR